jgi:pimeloyl-ACP methyl ester carboxylesterase
VSLSPWTVSHAVRAEDATTIRVRFAPAADGSRDLLVVLVPGFSGHSQDPRDVQVASWLAESAGVVGVDLRGHGESGGVSTVGDREVLDLAAAVEWARTLGYRSLATIGFSMGGAVVARYAGLVGDTDAAVLISAPSRWYYRGTRHARRAHWIIERPLGRVVARHGLRTRVGGAGWSPVPLEPRAAVRGVRVPLLVVHGDVDPYFPLDHAKDLAAAPGAQLWVEHGFAHAERAFTPDLAHRVTTWLRAALAPSAP